MNRIPPALRKRLQVFLPFLLTEEGRVFLKMSQAIDPDTASEEELLALCAALVKAFDGWLLRQGDEKKVN